MEAVKFDHQQRRAAARSALMGERGLASRFESGQVGEACQVVVCVPAAHWSLDLFAFGEVLELGDDPNQRAVVSIDSNASGSAPHVVAGRSAMTVLQHEIRRGTFVRLTEPVKAAGKTGGRRDVAEGPTSSTPHAGSRGSDTSPR